MTNSEGLHLQVSGEGAWQDETGWSVSSWPGRGFTRHSRVDSQITRLAAWSCMLEIWSCLWPGATHGPVRLRIFVRQSRGPPLQEQFDQLCDVSVNFVPLSYSMVPCWPELSQAHCCGTGNFTMYRAAGSLTFSERACGIFLKFAGSLNFSERACGIFLKFAGSLSFSERACS